MATVVEGYPLIYDATNEYGLSIAGLNFPGNAQYFDIQKNMDNVAPFELIPWVLSQCKSVDDARKLLAHTNIANIAFNDQYALTPLHWFIADREQSITVESTANGLNIYPNPVGVLTNNPIFPYHLCNLANYMNITRQTPTNRFSEAIDLQPYSLGMGAIGLPGDLSSSSRFIRAAFSKCNSISGNSEDESVSQFFHILQSVEQINGCCCTETGFEKTIYSSCCNTDKGVYYYISYENHQITAVNLHNEDLDSCNLFTFPLILEQNIKYLN